MDKKALQIFLNKKVFVKLKDDDKAQVGILILKDNTYFLMSGNKYLSAINPEEISRITSEEIDVEKHFKEGEG